MPEFRFDDWIDQQLRNVPLPPNLLERLSQAGPNRGADDAQVDAALCDVAVPVDLPERLRAIARPSTVIMRRRRPAWQRYATAASLFLVIGLAAAGIFGLVTGALVPGEPQVANSAPQVSPSTTPPVEPLIDTPKVTDRSDRLADRKRRANAESEQPTSPEATAVAAEPAAQSKAPGADVAPVAAVEPKALGADGALARLPDLDVFASEPIRGIAPPLVEGYDLLFQLKHGEHPFVSPGDHQSLAETKLPFSFRTASYDRAVSSLESGQLPAADEIRVEDFIAAQDYGLPAAPPAGLALQVAGSESPFAATTASRAVARAGKLDLLTLAVQGAWYDAHAHRPHQLVVAIDSSAAMNAGDRMSGVHRALSKLARHMGENNRVTLLRFAETASIVAENLNRSELASLLESDSLSATRGTASLSAAIETVSKVARDAQSVEPRQVVVVTSIHGNYDPAELPGSAGQLSTLARMDVPWRLVRLNADAKDAHWEQLASKAHGKIAAAQSPDDIYQEMYEAMTRWPAKVARNVSVTLRLNPQSVAAYRLLGHEATTLNGLSPEPVEIDLGVDQTAVGVYEIALKPGTVTSIGSIKVVWQHPTSGRPGQIVRPITRNELVNSFFTAPAWHQKAVLAAKGAESLRGSAYLPATRPVARVLDVAVRVDASLAHQPDFTRLVDLLKSADRPR